MSKLGSWSTTPGSNNSTPPDGWPEGQAPSTVNDCAREMMASIRTVFNDPQYFDPNLTPTFINTTSFSVAGDQTSAIHAGRRLKIFDATVGGAAVFYATVATASFTTVTTVSVSTDAGVLTSSLSSFALAILSRNNPSLPQGLPVSASSVATGNLTVAGTTTASGAVTLLTTLSVSGTTTLKGALTVGGAIIVAGNAQLNGLLSVSGDIVAKSSLQIKDALSVSGTMVVTGVSTFSGTVVAANVSKAWVRFSAANPPSIDRQFNVASVSRSATGVYRVNFTNVFAANTYGFFVVPFGASQVTGENAQVGSFKCTFTAAGGTAVEAINVMMHFMY